ncbi:hypothetical protein [Salinicoccus kekensis]|uniref:Uncharacterized protein n=1 Tax=Salinicoccus kekensis TaxID=714307 RepID=A0A285UM28_9STAP|nr:hypothetical protein [Salinicoccus kekensis]SOC42813.1 hypothetical protein SAMN05878391_1751 [Salinicoccus kekensis]
MQVVDQSGQRAVLAMQVIFMTFLKLVTFGRSENINRQLEKMKEEYKEISQEDRL